MVVTTVHNPPDARIFMRQIPALRARGWDVTYAAAFSAYNVTPPVDLRWIDLPRSHGLHRLRAIWSARKLMKDAWREYDCVLFHDPELLAAVQAVPKAARHKFVWDVHEDLATQVFFKPWLPVRLRRLVAGIAPIIERWAERNINLILAEHRYQERLTAQHLVVPNTSFVPPTAMPAGHVKRVIYVGGITRIRGWFEIEAAATQMRGEVEFHVVGNVDAECRPHVEATSARGDVIYHGFLPNDQALALVSGSLAGLSLLHPVGNYVSSMPTKVLEYMANGIPYISTDLPEVRSLHSAHGGGFVIPQGDPAQLVSRIRQLLGDPELARSLGREGHLAALQNFNWNVDGEHFVDHLTSIASSSAVRKLPSGVDLPDSRSQGNGAKHP